MRNIIIFGGSGLVGNSIKDLFLDNQYQVINIDIKDEINNHPNLIHIKYDLSLISTVEQLSDLLKEYLNNCRGLINCTLLPYPEFDVKNLSKENLYEACSSLLVLDFFISTLAVNYAQDKSINSLLSVILISSVKASIPPKFRHYENTNGMNSSPFYGTMKAASLMLIKHFASAYRDLGITFNAIAPGGVNGETHSKTFLDQYRKSTSNVGLIDPQYIALAAKYIVDSGPAVNGSSICVDSGWSCD